MRLCGVSQADAVEIEEDVEEEEEDESDSFDYGPWREPTKEFTEEELDSQHDAFLAYLQQEQPIINLPRITKQIKNRMLRQIRNLAAPPRQHLMQTQQTSAPFVYSFDTLGEQSGLVAHYNPSYRRPPGRFRVGVTQALPNGQDTIIYKSSTKDLDIS